MTFVSFRLPQTNEKIKGCVPYGDWTKPNVGADNIRPLWKNEQNLKLTKKGTYENERIQKAEN